MSRSLLTQLEQIQQSSVYNDSVSNTTYSGVAEPTSSGTLEDDLNVLRTVIKLFKGTSKWYGDLGTYFDPTNTTSGSSETKTYNLYNLKNNTLDSRTMLVAVKDYGPSNTGYVVNTSYSGVLITTSTKYATPTNRLGLPIFNSVTHSGSYFDEGGTDAVCKIDVINLQTNMHLKTSNGYVIYGKFHDGSDFGGSGSLTDVYVRFYANDVVCDLSTVSGSVSPLMFIYPQRKRLVDVDESEWVYSTAILFGANVEATSSGTGYTNKMAQDAVGGILTDTATIDFTYNEPSSQITADVKSSSISNSLLSNVSQNTIKGRISSGTGVVEDLTASGVRTIINVADGAVADHLYILNKGTNTHDQIDSHIGAAAPHSGHALLSHAFVNSTNHTASGLVNGQFLKATGATTYAFGNHDLTASSVGAEPYLNLPASDGYTLYSTASGVRSWGPTSSGVTDHYLLTHIGTNTHAQIDSTLSGLSASSHSRQHSITSTSDHTSSATSGQLLKADSNGLPVNATNTDAQVSATVSASHAQSHVFATTSGLGTDHTVSGLTTGQVLVASGASAALFRALTSSDVGLGNVSNTAQITSVAGTFPIISSGGTTPTISISGATTSGSGSMSAADKSKLDGIASGAVADHLNIANKGTNTHVQIDSHISAAAPHTGHALTSHAFVDTTNHTVSGLTTGHFLKATGATTYTFAEHGITASGLGAEPSLGNPAVSGYVLSSTISGVRSWVAQSSAANPVDIYALALFTR